MFQEILDYLTGPIFIGLYFGTGYWISLQIRRRLKVKHHYLRLLILSFVYTLIFGIGIVGGFGDPGFAFPFPIIITLAAYIAYPIPFKLVINGLIIPLFFWWALIYTVMSIRHIIVSQKKGSIITPDSD